MTIGSLCSGIAGFELGFEWAGFDVKWQVEKDPFCMEYLEAAYPHTTKVNDIHEAGKHNLEPVDVICAGFPCQPFSVAGERGGASDDRYLWPEVKRVIDEIRPSAVVLENVPGILSMEQPAGIVGVEGRDILSDYDAQGGTEKLFGQDYERSEKLIYRARNIAAQVLADLQAIGYEVPLAIGGTPIVFSIPAISVDAWHIRQRVFFVAFRAGARERCDTAYAIRTWQLQQSELERKGRDRTGDGNEVDANAKHKRCGRRNENKEKRKAESTGTSSEGEDADDADANGRRRGWWKDYLKGQTVSNLIERGRERLNKKVQLRTSGTPTYCTSEGLSIGQDQSKGPAEKFKAAQRGYYHEGEPSQWLPEPDLARLVHGFPHRRSLVRAFGNAVVPPQIFQLARMVAITLNRYDFNDTRG